MRRTRGRALVRPLSGAGLAVCLAVAALSLGAEAKHPEAGVIQAVVRGAITDAMDAGTYKSPDWKTGPLDGSVVAGMHQVLDRRLGDHMTGRALAEWRRALHEAIDRDSDGEHVIVTAGGVDQIEFETVDVVDESAATATGRAHVWATWVIHKADVGGPHTGRPNGWDHFAAALLKVDGEWLVDDLLLQPEAGG